MRLRELDLEPHEAPPERLLGSLLGVNCDDILVVVAAHEPAGDVALGGTADLFASETLPFRQRDPCLSENGAHGILPDIASVGIRNPHAEMLLDHELVLPSRKRPTKAQLPETTDQLAPRSWPDARHQATS